MSAGLSMRAVAVVTCPTCGKSIFDGIALKSRVVLVGQTASQAKCSRCRTMVTVPVVLAPQRR